MATTTTNLYNDLQKIASQVTPKSSSSVDGVDKMLAEYDTKMVQDMTNLANTMYPEDTNAKFSFWKSRINVGLLAPQAKEAYWSQYEKMHPDGIVGAKRDFINVTKRELDVVPGLSGKEFFLRERLADTPVWARKELDPVLGELSAVVANANYSKSQQVYMQDLDSRMGRFMTTAQLDPDIPTETHTSDAVRLEQLNLMSLGKVQSGRIGVYNEKGVFFPAFGIKDRSEIFKQDPNGSPSLQEQRLVRELAPNIIRKTVEGNLATRRRTIQSEERASTVVASNYLKTGAFGIDKWDTAFSMLPEIPLQERLNLGLQGEIASGRIASEQDLVRTIYQTMVKYGNLFEETK